MSNIIRGCHGYVCAMALFSLVSCHPSLYQVVGADSYSQVAQHPHTKKYILIKNSWVAGVQADTLAALVNEKRWKALQQALTDVENQQARVFFQAIKDMKQHNYQQAYQRLSTLPDDGFGCQIGLLKADCLYELSEHLAALQSHYQQVYDCTADDAIKQITTLRYRFTKYDY